MVLLDWSYHNQVIALKNISFMKYIFAQSFINALY